MDLDRLIDFYQELTPDSLRHLPEFYSADAYFKDPFNEVRGVAAVLRPRADVFTVGRLGLRHHDGPATFR